MLTKDRSPWLELALTNNLAYKPGHLFNRGSRVEGHYRGYHLHLTHWTFGFEITLSVIDPHTPVLSKETPLRPVPPVWVNDLLIDPHLTSILQGYFRATKQGRIFYYHQLADTDNLSHDVHRLQKLFDLLCTLADDYRKLLAQGGHTIPALQDRLAHWRKLPGLVEQLLQDIEQQTLNHLKRYGDLYCLPCRANFTVQPVNIPGLLQNINFSYYGCRYCGQSRQFKAGRVIAVLDNKLYPEQILSYKVIRLNWFMLYKLFDFDELHIHQASDEEVERFAVAVGNDTDPYRQAKYKQIPCLISTQCNPSPNTWHILRQMFGRVEWV